MKRKVIKQGNNTLTLTLPKEWTSKYNIKAGDELEIEEKEKNLILGFLSQPKPETIDIDLSGLDRTSIMLYIRSYYRLGYNEIRVHFKNQMTKHYRKEEDIKVLSVIHQEINRLIGVEVIEQGEGFCTIRNLSADPIEDFDMILRKIFFQIDMLAVDFFEAVKRMDFALLETVEEKHDTITKFISYCLRLLNKRGYPEAKKTNYLYYTINSLDIITDIIKYVTRDILRAKSERLTKKSLVMIGRICDFIKLYSKFFYSPKLEMASEILKARETFLKDLESASKALPGEDLLLLVKLGQVTDLIKELVGIRMGLMHVKSLNNLQNS